MPASTSISERLSFSALFLIALLALTPAGARADDNGGGNNNNNGATNNGTTGAPDRTNTPEEEDFSNTPYTEYGEFNEEKEEEENNRFFQYGRFFGVSLGLGMETADGDRGTLLQGGFPTFDFKIHYWFDFHFAMDMDFTYAEHYFLTQSTFFGGSSGNAVRYNVNIMRLGIDIKYYFDVKNLSAPISFANPYVLVGFGSYTKTESSATGATSTNDSENAVGFNLGAGLEFALDPRKVYLTTEAKIHLVQFSDYNTSDFASSEGLPDQHGNFYTFIASILFTW